MRSDECFLYMDSLFRVEGREDEDENDDIEALLWHWIRSCDITQVADEGVTSGWVVLRIGLSVKTTSRHMQIISKMDPNITLNRS